MTELVARSLELPPDADFCGVEVDVWPGEPECFATAQPEDEDQHVGRIQRVLVAPGGFQEGACLLDGPPLSLSFPGIGQPHDRGDIAGQQLFGDSVGECGAEHVAYVLDGPVGEYLMAASADSTAAAVIRGSCGIFALGAALAGNAKPVEPGADIADLEPVKPLGSETWDEIQAGEQGVPFSGLGCEVRLDDFAQPVRQVAGQCRRGRGHRAFPGPCLELDPLLVYLVVCLVGGWNKWC